MRRERMLGYYPNAIKSIAEFNAIIDAESPEVDSVDTEREQVVSDAYLPTMSERRVIQWEKKFGIQPLEKATLDDRRNIIIARIRGQGKLNTNLINTIVKTFTGQGCECWVEDGNLIVLLLPFDESSVSLEDTITNITNELSRKIPAHLGLDINLAYTRWSDVNNNNASWTMVNTAYSSWANVMFGRQGKLNKLNYSKLDEFYLG